MSNPDPRSVVRIAIALVALTHKPRHQSNASYLLDLQSHFPLPTQCQDDSRDWRTYALELETQITALKAQRDADQELLATLTSDPPPPKKKSKKNPAKDQQESDWSWDQSRADWSRRLSSQYPSSPSLIAAFTSVRGILASSNADPFMHASRLTDAILRALDTIHIFLLSDLNPSPDLTTLGPPLQLSPQHMDSTRIAMVSPLLMYLLRTALPALLRAVQVDNKSKRQRPHIHSTAFASIDAQAHIDNVLDQLLECVLLPVVRALAPLCLARLAPLVTLPPPKKPSRPLGKGKSKDKDKDKHAELLHPKNISDTRTDAFALIGMSLEVLGALPPFVRPIGPCPSGPRSSNIVVGIRDRLGLETIRELEALYGITTTLVTPELPPSSESYPPPVTPSEAAPWPTPVPTPQSTQSNSQTQPQVQRDLQQYTGPELRMKQLERLTGTRAERVRALATRDAGWLLAKTLDLCLIPPPGGASSSSHCDQVAATGELLRQALLDRIGKLARSSSGVLSGDDTGDVGAVTDDDRNHAHGRCFATDAPQRAYGIDPVCQDMLLAICERAMTQLAP